MTLTEFLLARIAEDEAVAREALDPDRPGTHWQWVNPETDRPFDIETGDDFRASLRTLEEFPTTSGVGDLPAFPLGYVELDETYALPHIARHDPARVLAECEAKRRIMDEHYYMARHDSRDFGFEDGNCITCRKQGPCATLRHLAAVYADHPDFDESWRA